VNVTQLDPREFANAVLWSTVALVLIMAAVVVLERSAFLVVEARRRRLERRYQPLVSRALDGDHASRRALATSPARHRPAIAALLILPLIDNRDLQRIEDTRAIVRTLSLRSRAERHLRSWWWWRRATTLRALGLIRAEDQTATIVAGLDDEHPDVRAAALDALTDLQSPASLQAIVVRMHDASLHRGRRAAALASFGSRCEPFLLELADVDPAHRLNYARALEICGTERSRAALWCWMGDPRADVRAAALGALARIGLDERCAGAALKALDSTDVQERAMAARALNGWSGSGAAARLARHLDDTWTVAVCAARSLRSMGDIGLVELQASLARPGNAGLLARQMLWDESVRL
jgi:HEAT repeat protein